MMLVRKQLITAFLGILTLIAVPRTASADWLFTPFIGTAFNADADFGGGFDEPGEFERRFTYGASLGYMGAGVIGFEFDFGYTPNFFETIVDDGDFTFADDSNVTTLMANVIIGIPLGGQTGFGVRPYLVGGAGLLRTHVEGAGLFFEDLDSNEFGFNVGGGVNIFFVDSVGIRGDVRYFRTFSGSDDDELDFDIGDFDFWRATAGVTFRW